MNSLYKKIIALLATTAVTLVAPVAFAATPKAFLEQAQVFATGKRVQAFRVPTTDSNGKKRYFDVTVDLTILEDGSVDTNGASVKAIRSKNFASNKFIAGTYKDNFGATCTVVTNVLKGGRTEASISCVNGSASFQANWFTGGVSGHPFELELTAAGVDQLGSFDQFSWGKVGNTAFGNDWWGCMDANDILSARQIGSTLAIGGYEKGNVQNCGVNLIKQ